MRIICVHNYYQQRGGEDEVFDSEISLLRDHGHDVLTLTADSAAVGGASLFRAALENVWSLAAARQIDVMIRQWNPDLVHVHNLFPQISPSVIAAARQHSVPVVATLHNYRLACIRGDLFRNGSVCLDCLESGHSLPGIVHRCYRDSLAASTAAAVAREVHQHGQIWNRGVTSFIAPSQTARDTMARAGLPVSKITIKPHFLHPDPGIGTGATGDVVLAGRLSAEKGIELVVSTWARNPELPPLSVIGDGPLQGTARRTAAGSERIRFLGAQSRSDTICRIGGAAAVVSGSLCRETFGLVALESLATGTPCVVPSGTALAELVEPGKTGEIYEQGDARALAQAVLRAVDADGYVNRRQSARLAFERRYTAQTNYDLLMKIYESATSAAS